MRVIFHILYLLILYIAASNSSIISNAKAYLKNSIRHLRDSLDHNKGQEDIDKSRFEVKHDYVDGQQPKAVIRIFKAKDGFENWRGKGSRVLRSKNAFPTKNADSLNREEERYRLDSVMNSLRRENSMKRNITESYSSGSSSSSLELRDWKEEWREHLIKKKLEAIDSSGPKGDVVNMVAARPWGVRCGDPNQHDMPWGTCMLPMECDSEYRIYRGDYACGRTNFVCCAIENTNYDMNQAFDASFDDSGLSTDSNEKKGNRSKRSKRKRKQRDKQRRRKKRQKRKKEIKRKIKKIIKEIRKILNRQYNNGTSQRKKKTKQLKKFISDLKKKYKQDRKVVKNVHEIEIVKVDAALKAKLEEIRKLNHNFVTNGTFRDILVKGKISRSGARMLVQAYPELVPFFADTTRRSGAAPKDYLDYDVEYGMLYY